jgi:hypothetical protein
MMCSGPEGAEDDHLKAHMANSSAAEPPQASLFMVSPPIQPRIHQPEEEIAFGPACWLWDYLRYAGMVE